MHQKFSEKYRTDPEYKKKHLNYMKKKVECTCGFITSRSNMSRHKRSRNHLSHVEQKNSLINRNLIIEIKDKKYDLGNYDSINERNWMWNYFILKYYNSPPLLDCDVTTAEHEFFCEKALKLEEKYGI